MVLAGWAYWRFLSVQAPHQVQVLARAGGCRPQPSMEPGRVESLSGWQQAGVSCLFIQTMMR